LTAVVQPAVVQRPAELKRAAPITEDQEEYAKDIKLLKSSQNAREIAGSRIQVSAKKPGKIGIKEGEPKDKDSAKVG
jgi:hypothetical protein